MRLASMQLATELGKVELVVVTKENRQVVVDQLEGWNTLNPLYRVRGQPSTGQPSTWTTIRCHLTTIRYHKI